MLPPAGYVFFLLLSLLSTTIAKDRSTERRANGTDVVLASITKLQDSCIFPNDFQFLRRIAWHESHDGIEFKQTSWDIASGIWGTDDYILQTVQGDSSDDKLAVAEGQLDSQFNITIDKYSWTAGDMEIPLYSAAVARAKLYAAKHKLPLTLKEQADFWAANYHQGTRDANDFLKSMASIPPCKTRGMDLMFMVDSSGSIGDVEGAFDNARNFVVSVIEGLKIGDHATRVGIIDFSSVTQLVTTFSGDRDAVIKAAQNMDDQQGMTATGDALRMATTEFIHRARDPSKGWPLVAILITDGQPNWSNGTDADPQDALDAAEELKKAGITLFTIGIANARVDNLQETASNPKCQHFYVLNAYKELAEQFPNILLSQTCTVSASIPPDVHHVNASVEQDQAAYFRLAANVSDGVTLKVSTEAGDTTLYASLTNRLPSSADYDFKADAPQGTLGQIFITPEDLEKVLPPHKTAFDVYALSDVPEEEKGQTVTVFSAVFGKSPTNNFTMFIDDGNAVVSTTTTTTTTSTTSPTTTTPTHTTKAAGHGTYIISFSLLCLTALATFVTLC